MRSEAVGRCLLGAGKRLELQQKQNALEGKERRRFIFDLLLMEDPQTEEQGVSVLPNKPNETQRSPSKRPAQPPRRAISSFPSSSSTMVPKPLAFSQEPIYTGTGEPLSSS